MLTQRATEITREMVRLKSVTFQEEAAARYLERFFLQAGFSVEVDEVNNVVAELKGSGGGKRVFFLGHHDTVEEGDPKLWTYPPFEAAVAQGRIWGRGTADEKGGLAACMAAVEKLLAEDRNIRGDILIVSSREETSDLSTRGIVKLLDRGIEADFCIVVEPTCLEIMLGHKGRAVIDIETHGKTAHSSVPEMGINAINHMARLLLELEAMPLPDRPPLGRGTQSAGVIAGGVRPNIVPERCSVSIDRRIVGGESAASVEAEIRAVIDRLAAKTPGFKATFSIRPPYLPSYIDKDAYVVRALSDVLREIDAPVRVGFMDGHTDGEWIVNDLGIPAVILGPGDMRQAHATDEYVEIEQLGRAAEIYYRLLRKELY
ncbi:MAG: M20 family metallopeptidase [Candidatus Accumulibacter sp.]|jgi:acetylornithine deacetylase/succinyl-diaminopimelate desuccinylase family protein|nr:M20 family metallopeptidase [Accumulibacter sp.]